MAFPLPRPARPELPQRRVRALECGQGAVRAVRFNGASGETGTRNRGGMLRKYRGHAGVRMRRGSGGELRSLGGIWGLRWGLKVRELVSGGALSIPEPPQCPSPPPGSIDSTVRCWDCRSRRPDPVQVLDEAKDGVSSVKLSSHEILSGSVDGHVRRYDLRAGQLYCDYVGSPITSVCFSKDGQCTLAASLDSTLRLLDKDTGELLGEYKGHRSTTYRLDCVLSEQDTHVGCASEDGHVYFWDLVEGSLARSLPVGRGVVQSLSFHPTLPCLLAATEGQVQLWREDSFQEQGDTEM
uniref:WD repeat domain-containing protein 83 n=1 Tax=Amazona collaria TaxID=241587 RepID=A0A8B9FLG4_9PSIT